MITEKKNKEPKYYETWAELIVDMRFHRVIASAALFAFFIILFWSMKVLNRPPIVIRVDQLGNPAIVEAKSAQVITPQEVQNFVTYFVEYWRGWDFYKFDDNFNRVYTMKTAEMTSKSNSFLRDNKVIERIKSEKLRYKITLTNIVIKSRDKNFVVVEVTGNREEGSYETTIAKQVRFMTTLVLAVVPRMSSPWGLLAVSYDERVFD
ncbi:MAG: hypothetical protein CVT48_01100 [Thermoplasmata archaeon HGW-Thermoplasmata-1]|nr:MAG: hypothetical protein CVT48_01100 [Thermoplasmata archaeon HGW-Thermoplasmata-1]